MNTTTTNEPLATLSRIPGERQFPYRTFYYTIAQMGFDRGQRVYVGKSQWRTLAEAQAAVDAWNAVHSI